MGPKSWETGCRQAHPLPQTNRPGTDSRRALGANPAASGVHSFPSPSGWARAATATRAKAPSARSRRGWSAPGDFSLPSTGFAIALLRIMAEAGNPNSPTGLRGGGFILQRRTHSDRPGISGGEGMRSFRTPECGKNKTLPTHARYHLTWWEGVQGHQAPDFSVPRGSFCQSWDSFSLYRRKTRFKKHSTTVVLYQSPSTCDRLRQRMEAARSEGGGRGWE